MKYIISITIIDIISHKNLKMTRSYKKETWDICSDLTNYEKQKPLFMHGIWIDPTNKEEETSRVLKRTVYTNTDGKKKHGKFLTVKEGKTVKWVCPKHNITRHPDCDFAEKYKPKSKTLIKYEMVKNNSKDID